MVFIKRIDIRGFKTFSKKVSISLDRGFTVITGPNGSGKSNILDGLRFALGELSPKELRGRSLSDLVHKSQGEGPRSAYVAAQFDNSDRKIPVESDLVTISREFSRGGEGIYRLNGRRLSRKQVQDIMSSADIQVTGFNLIAQHAITRLAEIGGEERRKILEDLIGIGVFEMKKAEAKDQLSQADLNLKVAAARVDEVRQRIEQLERERNDLLRYMLLKNEIGLQQARILSGQIAGLESKRSSMTASVEEAVGKLEEVRHERDLLVQRRAAVEGERRKFEEGTVNRGSRELFEIERRIAQAGIEVVKAKTEVDTVKTLLATRAKQKVSLTKEIDEMGATIGELPGSIRSFTMRKASLDEKFNKSAATAEKLTLNLKISRESVAADMKKLESIQDKIDGLSKELARLTASGKGSSTKLDLTAGHMQTLEARHQEFSQIADDLRGQVREMEKLEKEETKRLERTDEKMKETVELKAERLKEIEEAIDVAKRARVTVIEFNTQKDLAEKLQAEERAIQKIEEMGEEGAIKGVLGRLKNLVKFDDEYGKAVEAASAGWMRALVVKDLSVAIRCVESLKRTKLGRVKIIPLEDLELRGSFEDLDEKPGIIGLMSKVIKSEKAIIPAVLFVFGDTFLATNQRAAFLTAAAGQRCVVMSGDLYEPGGALESGYYRAPFDITTIVPRPVALEGLEKTVKSLEASVLRQRSEVDRLESDVTNLREERISSGKTREAMERELEHAKKSLELTKTAMQGTRRRIESLRGSMERERQLLDEMTEKQSEIKLRLAMLEEDRDRLKTATRRAHIEELERERERAANESEALLREKLDVESKLASQQSSLDTMKPSLEQFTIQIRSLDSEIHREEERVRESNEKMEALRRKTSQMELEKEGLVTSLSAVSEERKKYEDQFGEIEMSLKSLLEKMDPLNSNATEMKAGLRGVETQLAVQRSQLQGVGFQEELDVSPESSEGAEELKHSLQEELDGIGAVNQLADQQYEDQKDGYKQLSVRISDLEREKLAIVDFMNELESKKRDTFMSAFNRVNETFQQLFSEMTTGGGKGRIVLDNPDDPFAGGLDVLLQFPGKPELTMGSASGGEKSVATVCYLLALQQIHPMPFYVMDEIDAHLDVVNTKRLATLVRSRSKGSQFIVISLKDTTISMAERVFGVFQEKGMSQVVSLPVRGSPVDN